MILSIPLIVRGSFHLQLEELKVSITALHGQKCCPKVPSRKESHYLISFMVPIIQFYW